MYAFGGNKVNSNKTREFMWGEDEEKLEMYT